jgi:hypothetical protein
LVSVGTGDQPASYYPESGEAEVRIYRYAPDVINELPRFGTK